MKKILLLTTALVIFSTQVNAENNKPYVRADIGANFFKEEKAPEILANNRSLKMKSSIAPSLSLGVGRYISEKVRGELEYSHLFDTSAKGNIREPINSNAIYHHKTKIGINALLVKGYVDVAHLGVAKLFLGGGAGVSRIKDNLSASTERGTLRVQKNIKLTKTHLAWSLAAGSSTDITDIVKLDMQYNFIDFGNTKPGSNASSVKNIKHRSHTVKLGARLDI